MKRTLVTLAASAVLSLGAVEAATGTAHAQICSDGSIMSPGGYCQPGPGPRGGGGFNQCMPGSYEAEPGQCVPVHSPGISLRRTN